MNRNKLIIRTGAALATLFVAANAFAGDADINLPDLKGVSFFNGSLSGPVLLYLGLAC